MKILLDTHVALWFFSGDKRLPANFVRMVGMTSNDVYVSLASVWELQIKSLLHPDRVPLDAKTFVRYMSATHYALLPITADDVFALETLRLSENAPRHNDPFDRILLAQAKTQEMLFLTHDSKLMYYQEPCVLLV